MASFTERYHILTKYNPNTIDKLESVHWEESPSPFKPINQNDKIPLKSFLKISPNNESDKSLVSFTMENPLIDLSFIAHLLYFTGGITAKIETAGGDYFLRANPSAGALYPTEIYLSATGIKDLPDGLYYFHPLMCELIPIRLGNILDKLNSSLCLPPGIKSAGLQVLFTGIFARSAWRYKERAYRRILLDTGHALGNMLEICRHVKIQPFLWGGFIDEKIESLFKLEPKSETPLIAVSLSEAEHYREKECFQPPSLSPVEAVRYVDKADSIQVQQNTCERIHRPPVIETIPHKEMVNPGIWKGVPDLFTRIIQRRSCREFTGEPLDFAEVKEILEFGYQYFSYPSFYLSENFLESYLVALNVEDLAAGSYKLKDRSIEFTDFIPGDFRNETLHMSLGQELSHDCSFILVHVVDLAKLVGQYGDRGYRYICMDAGAIGQRINLVSESIGAGSSGIGGYYDDMVNETLNLPMNFAVIYITVVGKPRVF